MLIETSYIEDNKMVLNVAIEEKVSEGIKEAGN
jgi:hypothetical protein